MLKFVNRNFLCLLILNLGLVASCLKNTKSETRSEIPVEYGAIIEDADSLYGKVVPMNPTHGIKPHELIDPSKPAEPSNVVVNQTTQEVRPGRPPLLESTKGYYNWIITADVRLLVSEDLVIGKVEGKDLTLGHPTMVGAQPARIAGELRFSDGQITINNESGRYSYAPDRKRHQLENAAKLFREAGVQIDRIKLFGEKDSSPLK